VSIGDRPLIALGGPALLRVVKLADVKATALIGSRPAYL
jgi:hypothetical protein